MQARTTYHIHCEVGHLLSLPDRRLGELIIHPEGVQAAREELRGMLARGVTCLPAGQCDNRKPDGSCAGHPVQEEAAA